MRAPMVKSGAGGDQSPSSAAAARRGAAGDAPRASTRRGEEGGGARKRARLGVGGSRHAARGGGGAGPGKAAAVVSIILALHVRGASGAFNGNEGDWTLGQWGTIGTCLHDGVAITTESQCQTVATAMGTTVRTDVMMVSFALAAP